MPRLPPLGEHRQWVTGIIWRAANLRVAFAASGQMASYTHAKILFEDGKAKELGYTGRLE